MEEKSVNNFISIKVFLKNLFLEFILSLFLLLVFAILLSKTSLSENIIGPVIIFISSFCILLGSFFSSRKMHIKGIVVGMLQGISYMLILYILSSILNSNFSLGKESLIMIIVGIICGAVRWNFRSKS